MHPVGPRGGTIRRRIARRGADEPRQPLRDLDLQRQLACRVKSLAFPHAHRADGFDAGDGAADRRNGLGRVGLPGSA